MEYKRFCLTRHAKDLVSRVVEKFNCRGACNTVAMGQFRNAHGRSIKINHLAFAAYVQQYNIKILADEVNRALDL